MQLCKGKIQLVYIGASGTMDQEGEFSKQLLKGRINNKQNGIKRQHFFEGIMEQNNIDALDIYWFVTFGEKHKHLPSYVEQFYYKSILIYMVVCPSGIVNSEIILQKKLLNLFLFHFTFARNCYETNHYIPVFCNHIFYAGSWSVARLFVPAAKNGFR